MNALKACVIGWPVAHSRSPLVHRHWLAEHGIAGAYEREAVPPQDFPTFLGDLAGRGYVGANVTLPHKEAALLAVDEADDTARALGAVNTVWLEDGRLHGTNTDLHGFLAHLDASVPGWEPDAGPAVLLGAGGAARGIAHALAGRGVSRLRIVNRTRDRAEALARRIGPTAEAFAWSEAARALEGATLLVNTTSLGMAGQPPLAVDLAPLAPRAIVYDVVYVPLETGLLARARAGGHRTVDGLGMLLHQAVPGFARWFGVTPDVTPELRAVVAADIPGGGR